MRLSSFRSFYLALSILGILVPAALTYSQGGYGTSSISFNMSSWSASPGQTGKVAYTVQLATGGKWGTTLSVSNQASLSQSGITVSISNPVGDPTYSGIATITTGASTAPGTYHITFVASGDDPSAPANVTVIVAAPATTTATATTIIASNRTSTSNSTSMPSTTTIQSTSTVSYPVAGQSNSGASNSTPPIAQQSSLPLDVSALAIVVLFAVIIAALKFPR